MRAWLCALAITLSVAGPAISRARQNVKARYQTRDGPSPWQPTTVTYLSGNELNTLTTSLQYGALSTYAVIFFAEGQAAVIQLDAGQCYGAATVSCAWGLQPPSLSFLTGQDQEGRQWDFCAPENWRIYTLQTR